MGRAVHITLLSPEQINGSRRAFTTRNVPASAMRTLVAGGIRPRAGDLVLARIVRLGQHRRIELPNGRKAALHVGDEIIVCYGDRYAPDQFEAEVPLTLGHTNLVASGGIAADALSKSMDVRLATRIAPLGLVASERGRPLNLADFTLERPSVGGPRPRTIAVVGTSMNSGKTTTIASLVYALSKAGARPGATKVTGTGSGGDYWVMLDAGAHKMLDFTDVGMASTYRQPMSRVEEAMDLLVSHLSAAGSGINLVEIADGIYQRETSRLIRSETFRRNVDGIIFAAGDAGGALAGVTALTDMGHNVIAVSGRLTRSPLAVREAAEITGMPIPGRPELMDTDYALSLVGIDRNELSRPQVSLPEAWPEEKVPHPIIDIGRYDPRRVYVTRLDMVPNGLRLANDK